MALIDELRRYQRYARAHKHVPPMALKPAELDEIIAAVEVAGKLPELADEYIAETIERGKKMGGWVRGSCAADAFVRWLQARHAAEGK